MDYAHASQVRTQCVHNQIEKGMYIGAVGVQRDKEANDRRIVAGLTNITGRQINGGQTIRVTLIEVEHSAHKYG